jgi:hypothetical protein
MQFNSEFCNDAMDTYAPAIAVMKNSFLTFEAEFDPEGEDGLLPVPGPAARRSRSADSVRKPAVLSLPCYQEATLTALNSILRGDGLPALDETGFGRDLGESSCDNWSPSKSGNERVQSKSSLNSWSTMCPSLVRPESSKRDDDGSPSEEALESEESPRHRKGRRNRRQRTRLFTKRARLGAIIPPPSPGSPALERLRYNGFSLFKSMVEANVARSCSGHSVCSQSSHSMCSQPFYGETYAIPTAP